MPGIDNPALRAFAASVREELIFAQVLVRRLPDGWELRHADDRGRAGGELRILTLEAIRPLAQFTAAGEFRPLKSAPTLAAGWRFTCATDELLYEALNRLYPGAVADWFAAQQANPPVTHYREFTARQSGMYRITTALDDVEATAVIAATCAASRCLKRRLWLVAGLAADAPEAKSLIPCLEPCAIALEAARKAARAKLDAQAGAARGARAD